MSNNDNLNYKLIMYTKTIMKPFTITKNVFEEKFTKLEKLLFFKKIKRYKKINMHGLVFYVEKNPIIICERDFDGNYTYRINRILYRNKNFKIRPTRLYMTTVSTDDIHDGLYFNEKKTGSMDIIGEQEFIISYKY